MKICIISYEYPPKILGGSGTYAEFLYKGLKETDNEVYLISRTNDVSDPNMISITETGKGYWRQPKFLNQALNKADELKEKKQFDILHLNEPRLLTRRNSIPIVTTIHSNQYNQLPLRWIDLKQNLSITNFMELFLKTPFGSISDILTAKYSDYLISPSQHLSNLIHKYCLVPKEKISFIPNSIDIIQYDATNDNEEILRRFNISKNNYILFMGRLSNIKGIPYLINAFKRVKKEHSSLQLVITGSGHKSYESYLRKLAGNEKDIIFTGYQNEITEKKALYSNSITVVFPSLYEGLPMSMLEAMACKRPIIASNVGGIPSLIKDEEIGFLTRPANVKDISENIQKLILDEDMRKKMGEKGRKIIENDYTVEKMIKKTLQLYQSIIK
jgi:glycosyltransferase involved in cell wall biosynthesis